LKFSCKLSLVIALINSHQSYLKVNFLLFIFQRIGNKIEKLLILLSGTKLLRLGTEKEWQIMFLEIKEEL
jgi:hypothetical protein